MTDSLINGMPAYEGPLSKSQRLTQCTRCGEVNPAEIHTCTPKQPEQEPVAWMHIQGDHQDPCFCELTEDEISRGWTQKPLYYTAPPQREWQGLTDEEQLEIMKMFGLGQRGAFADAIEAKLKEKNNG